MHIMNQSASTADLSTLKIDRDGNKVSFRNIDVFGGFKSIHYIKDNISERNEHVCYISNVKCYADEDIYGGIIIYVKN